MWSLNLWMRLKENFYNKTNFLKSNSISGTLTQKAYDKQCGNTSKDWAEGEKPTTAAALARVWAAFSCACKWAGGWKYRHWSRVQRPFTKSMQTVTVPSLLSTVTCSGGWAKRHSVSERLQLPRWNSRHTWRKSKKQRQPFRQSCAKKP